METTDTLSRKDLQFTLDFINDSLGVSDCDTLSSLILGLREEVSFDYSAIALLKLNDSGLESFDGINVNFPMEFAEQYILKNIPKVDPTVHHHLSNFGLSHWRDFASVPEMRELYGDFRIKEAYINGIRNKGSGSGSFFTISGLRVPKARRTGAILTATMPHLHQALMRVIGSSGRMKANPLSHRETEVLRWISLGKSSWDISMILNISERTVNFHATNIISKLDASNRTHAVAVALGNELIKLG